MEVDYEEVANYTNGECVYDVRADVDVTWVITDDWVHYQFFTSGDGTC